MKYYIAIILFYYFFSFNAYAQNEATLKDSIETIENRETGNKDFLFKRYKWDIATDLLSLLSRTPFVNLNRASEYTLQIRKNVLESVPNQFAKRKAAYRIRIGFNTIIQTSEVADTTTINNNYSMFVLNITKSNNFALLRLGKEWQKQFGRFQLVYGLDLHSSFIYNKSSVTDYTNNYGVGNTHQEDEINKILYYGISPFIGVKFFIHNRISISSEAAFSLLKKDHTIQRKHPMISTKTKESSIKATISPVSFLSLNYHF